MSAHDKNIGYNLGTVAFVLLLGWHGNNVLEPSAMRVQGGAAGGVGPGVEGCQEPCST